MGLFPNFKKVRLTQDAGNVRTQSCGSLGCVLGEHEARAMTSPPSVLPWPLRAAHSEQPVQPGGRAVPGPGRGSGQVWGSGSVSQSSSDLAVGSSGQISEDGPQGMWPYSCPSHLETEQRATHRWRGGRAGH